jgi:hypothetical protein
MIERFCRFVDGLRDRIRNTPKIAHFSLEHIFSALSRRRSTDNLELSVLHTTNKSLNLEGSDIEGYEAIIFKNSTYLEGHEKNFA